MRFWDSSALVPLLVYETVSDELLELYATGDVITWWGSDIECVSAIARLERLDQLGAPETKEALERLRRLAESWHLIDATESVKELSKRLLRVHDLRAADSLQLAAAVTAAEQRPVSLEFVCRDQRLALAAEREGFPTL